MEEGAQRLDLCLFARQDRLALVAPDWTGVAKVGLFDEVYRPETSSCRWSRMSDAFLVSEASAATPVPPFRSVLEPSSICLEDPSQRSATGDGLRSIATHLSRNHEIQFRTHLRILQEAATRSVELEVSARC